MHVQMPRDREAERERELERQRERERRWASGGLGNEHAYTASGKGRVMFFNTSTNDLGPTVAVAAALSLVAVALWGVGRMSLVAYHGNIKTGTCTVLAKELQVRTLAAAERGREGALLLCSLCARRSAVLTFFAQTNVCLQHIHIAAPPFSTTDRRLLRYQRGLHLQV